MTQQRKRRAVDGILLLDKPLDFTSNGILQKVRWLYQAKKAGHTGALDPLASGLLPLCFGEATKFSQFLLDTDKTYQVSARFGIRTDTSDAAGEVVSERPVQFDQVQLEQAMQPFRGAIQQVPTMFSALKHQGQPLYKYARQGISVPREARPITIFRFELLALRQTAATTEADFIVHCSKGTYIRTLIDDLGEALGCGAYVSALHRTQVGPFQAEAMQPLPLLESMAETCHAEYDFTALDGLLLPMDTALHGLPSLQLNVEQQKRIQHGQSFSIEHAEADAIRLYSEQADFLGIGRCVESQLLPRRLLNFNHE
ncbi:tRNA pseudouridine(55) synthase TruB [Alkalimonas collagenimarina]|uniref:tRNA pseudouridine synthase B n=1 Tax=Alkalimonas collagenimarina TaxID=400390 RepID=A0ABT9H1C7_9GAMM|nr:tRNA pseudouridine(55) synthase TruB [Alkalimonas collagenimarina]MDP4537107.1 tRNA pseudouridine(55) synthase TruB [Alkalimonas collagenimarina]